MAQLSQDELAKLKQLICVTAERVDPNHTLTPEQSEAIAQEVAQQGIKGEAAADLYNAILTGVISVYHAGGIGVVVQRASENPTGVADYSPEDGAQTGGSTLDQQSRDEQPLGDAFGENTAKFSRILGQGDIEDGLETWLEDQGYGAPQTAPTPRPPGALPKA